MPCGRSASSAVAARNFGPAGATPVGRGSGVLGVYRHIAIEPAMAQRDDDRRQWCTNRVTGWSDPRARRRGAAAP
jgi:hypothetical protein